MVEGEAGGALNIEITTTAEGALRAYDDRLAATRQLDRDKLVFVVFLGDGTQFGDQLGLVEGQGLDVCVRLRKGGSGSRPGRSRDWAYH